MNIARNETGSCMKVTPIFCNCMKIVRVSTFSAFIINFLLFMIPGKATRVVNNYDNKLSIKHFQTIMIMITENVLSFMIIIEINNVNYPKALRLLH